MELHFQIPSSTSCLPLVREKTSMFGSRLTMALVEAVDNAIFHAHKGDTSKTIDISIRRHDGKIVMEVKDQGEGFDINTVPEPDLYQVNGRGIFIIRSVMERVEYRNNTLIMIGGAK